MEHLGLCLFTCQMRYYTMIYWGVAALCLKRKECFVSREIVADWDPMHAASLEERG